ncbi:hypothetical protein ACWDQO_32605 [Streptomyces sp. NPDC003703]|uniref:hypothetical protein n=1 Tax=Streptomyces sp. NPDC003283 TaxID=3364681 RepID=UPI003690C295
MRIRTATTTALGITAALLSVPACSTDTIGAEHRGAAPARSGRTSGAVREPTQLSSAVLEMRLLDGSELRNGYVRKPQPPARHGDVTVLGCPALSELGGDAATGGAFAFPRTTKATSTYSVGGSEVSEELYSGSTTQLSDGISRIFDAMTNCPTYQVVAGGTTIDMASRKLPAPSGLGDEQWSQLLTFSSEGRGTVVKETAVRDGSVLLVLSGSPALVDRHLDNALAKATATG